MTKLLLLFPLLANAANDPSAAIAALGGETIRANGVIVEISLARTWANDDVVEQIASVKTLSKLDLSFTYVTDRGIEQLQQLPNLEELTLDTCEFITDAAIAYLRGNKKLRKLVLRGTDITDVSLPYIGELIALESLDLSQTMLGDGGLESLPALTRLTELDLGGTRISGINLNFLKLLPRLARLRFRGIQRRNGGVCWTPTLTDLDLETISLLSNLEELSLGVGLSLARGGKPVGTGNCRLTGGIHVSDFGLSKLARLRKLRWLDVSGARITAAGIQSLAQLPNLERLSLWNCQRLDDTAALGSLKSLTILDLTDTPITDAALQQLKTLPRLTRLYLTGTRTTSAAALSFQKEKPECFVSWAQL